MRFYNSIFLALLFLSTIHSANADMVELRGGDRMSGTIMLLKDPKALRFHTRFNQTLYIPWAEVTALYDNNGKPVYADYFQTTAYTAIPRIESNNITKKPFKPFKNNALEAVMVSSEFAPNYAALIEEAETKASHIAASDKNNKTAENQPSEAQLTGLWGANWSGRANIGASLQNGNSKKNAINADTTLKAKWSDKHRASIEAEYNREKDSGKITVDNKSLEGMYDYFFREGWFINSNLGFKTDDIGKIDLRTTLGTGIGHQAYESNELNLQYVFGPTYLRTEFENGSSEDSIAANWSLDYDQKFNEDLFQLFHNHEFLVPTNDTNAYLFDSKTGLRVPLMKGIVGTAEVSFKWDNDPEPGVVEDDTKYSVKLGYEW